MKFALEEKIVLLEALYSHLEKAQGSFSFACEEGCHLCCTDRLFTTSLEARYVFEVLKQEDFSLFENQQFLSPKLTHNQTLWLYSQGEEPPEEIFSELKRCPFLTREGLCLVYERRPLMCRIMVSSKKCSYDSPAEPPQEVYLMGLLALQIAENIDIGGLYGNLFHLLSLWRDFYLGNLEEIPPHVLPTLYFEELPLLPAEKRLRNWVGSLYRTELNPGLSFKDLLEKLREDFKKSQSLSFLQDIFST